MWTSSPTTAFRHSRDHAKCGSNRSPALLSGRQTSFWILFTESQLTTLSGLHFCAAALTGGQGLGLLYLVRHDRHEFKQVARLDLSVNENVTACRAQRSSTIAQPDYSQGRGLVRPLAVQHLCSKGVVARRLSLSLIWMCWPRWHIISCPGISFFQVLSIVLPASSSATNTTLSVSRQCR